MNNNEDYARYMYGYYHPIRTPSIDTPSIGTGIKREKENLLPEEKYHSNTTDNNNIYAKDNLNLDFNPNYVGPDFNEIVYDTDVSANGANGGSKRKTVKSNTTKKVVKKSKKVNNAKKPAAKKPAAKKPAAKKPAAKKPAAKKPATKKPTAKKPAAKKPVAKKPVAKKSATSKSKSKK